MVAFVFIAEPFGYREPISTGFAHLNRAVIRYETLLFKGVAAVKQKVHWSLPPRPFSGH